MKKTNNTYYLVTAAMMAAVVYIGTSVLQIKTLTGYVHIGDGMVILSGILLGPFYGGIAAGIGSMLADLFVGYTLWAPGTFLIKLIAAATAYKVFSIRRRAAQIKKEADRKPSWTAAVVISAFAAELVIQAGYFVYDIFVITILNGSFSVSGLSAAFTTKLMEIPAELFQIIAGIVVSAALAPVFLKLRQRYVKSAVNGAKR